MSTATQVSFDPAFNYKTRFYSRLMFSRRRVSTWHDRRNKILRKVRPMAFLTDLATNATAHNMEIVIYSGNDDSLVPHFGSQSKPSLWSSSLQLADMRMQSPSKCDITHFAHSSRV